MNTLNTNYCDSMTPEEREAQSKIEVETTYSKDTGEVLVVKANEVEVYPNTPDTEKEFVEKGADLEHTRWAKWQQYLHSKCVEHENGKGEWVCFPAELFRRWERQINTPYSELSEQEKESDRKEVRTYLPLIQKLLTSRDTYWKERVRKEVEDEKIKYENERLQGMSDYTRLTTKK